MARPKKEIDKSTFEKLCGLMCTNDEICGFLDVTDKTLSRWCKDTYGCCFSDAYKKYSATGKISLRRNQFKLSQRSAVMAIFLGKNYLGQTDVPPDMSDNMEQVLEKVGKVLGDVESVIE